MAKKLGVAQAILFTIITCGIYGIYWFITLNDSVNALAEDQTAPSGGMAFLYALITCGIYSFYWMYKMGEKLDGVYAKNGNPTQSRGILYLVLSIFGLAIVSYALMQDSVNKVIEG